jgi:hypothetical protein
MDIARLKIIKYRAIKQQVHVLRHKNNRYINKYNSLSAQRKDTPPYCDFFEGFFYILFVRWISEAAMVIIENK